MAFIGGGKGGYDRAITVFSPDGKLFQVQYAQEAVKRGYTALGIKTDAGVVLAAEMKPSGKLVENGSVEKIFQIDDHIGASASGLIADARVLMDRARIEAQVNRIRYDEPIPVQTLARSIGDIKQIYTQHAGVRPFGARFLIGGVEESGSYLFETDPSGVVVAYKAHAIGGGANDAIEVLEDKYDEKMEMDDIILLALNALDKVIEAELKPTNVEMATIKAETKKFQKLANEDLLKHIKRLTS
ncbi:proteasome subunit alpha [candidate division MSBL1 archaeon SCGC-AAA261F19]|uniref:Proteasome subunit alpha n=1 Tax=candidate division MSBL1 archaeon SCGC-AAA261F19 TaxID=1698275 RepID=A0A133VBB8_9EURY|nr:proteasome subunit alpha [candidate division MSBL1 archaeon SCGC-AAA261F19]